MQSNPYDIKGIVNDGTRQPVKPIDNTSPPPSAPPTSSPNTQSTPSAPTETSYDQKIEKWGSEFRSWGDKDKAVEKFVNKMKTDSSVEAQNFRKDTGGDTKKMTRIAENIVNENKKFPSATHNIIFK